MEPRTFATNSRKQNGIGGWRERSQSHAMFACSGRESLTPTSNGDEVVDTPRRQWHANRAVSWRMPNCILFERQALLDKRVPP